VADAIALPKDAVDYFVALACAWIREQRALHHLLAQPLPDAGKVTLAPFFPQAALDRARWRAVPAIENPPFLAEAAPFGVTLDFSRMDGITFDDTFLVREAALAGNADALVFHELVHIVQYGLLGIDEFISQYVAGYLSSGEYYTIPLELVAYTLQMRWMIDPAAVFSVEGMVQRTVGLRRA
jgi:hypothetical protein